MKKSSSGQEAPIMNKIFGTIYNIMHLQSIVIKKII